MRRGTTPTHIFKTSIDLSDAEVIYITYKQGSNIALEKSKEDIEVSSEDLRVKLTQEDTLKFKSIGQVNMQIRARFADGTAVACRIIERPVDQILKEGVI